MKNIWVAIVDDHLIVVKGISEIISKIKGMSVVLTAENGIDFFEKLESTNKIPDVVLMDIEMPKMSGTEVLLKLKAEYPNMKVVVLTMHDEESYMLYMLKNGADGYLFKNVSPYELEKAIYAVNEGELFFNDQAQKIAIESIKRKRVAMPNSNNSRGTVTEREKTVIIYICQGKSSIEIANLMNLSKRTVEGHRRTILVKTKSRNIADIIAFAVKKGIYSHRTDI